MHPHSRTPIEGKDQDRRVSTKRAVRSIINYYNGEKSATSMARDLNLRSLEDTKAHTKVTPSYKELTGALAIPTEHLQPIRISTRGHRRQLRIPDKRLNTSKALYYPDASRLWNPLLSNATEASTLAVFSSAIEPLSIRSTP